MIDKKEKTVLKTKPKKKRKKVAKGKRSSRRNFDSKTLKVKDSRKTIQERLSNGEDLSSDIIVQHLKSIENNSLSKGMRMEKIAFAAFLALPESLRGTQGKFSEDWGISEQSLSGWKGDADIQRLRLHVMRGILIDKTPAVLDNLFEAASKKNSFGNANIAAVKLWLQFVEEWQEASKISLEASGGFTINFGVGKSQFIAPDDEILPSRTKTKES